MSKVLITHNDLDGCVCAILFKTVFSDGVYYLENYDTVDERIKKALENNPEILYITDISPSEEVAKIVNCHSFYCEGSEVYQKVFLFDHHKTALDLRNYLWAQVDPAYCGARLFYEYLKRYQPVLYPYGELVWYANDYDLWHHKSSHSAVLNSLLYTIGHERFINRFLQNPSVELAEAEKYLLEIEKEKEEKYVQEAVEATKVFDTFAITIAERYTSQIGQKMLEVYPIDIAVIINARKGTVSFRSKETDVSTLAKNFGGGGHPKSAGFTLPKFLFHDEIADLLLEVMAC